MSAATLLEELAALGLRIAADGDRLRIRGPTAAITPDLTDRVRALKPDLIRLLSDPEAVRDALMDLAAQEGVSQAPVLALGRGDLEACRGEPETALRAYVRALARTELMARGDRPPGWSVASECAGCGPVWLAPGSPAKVQACPWCFHRAKGVRPPRPPVMCEGCTYFRPDAENPLAAMGDCAARGQPSEFPRKLHVCADFRSPGTSGENR